MVKFKASLVGVHEDEVLTIGFSDSDEQNNCVIIQYEDYQTEQDINMGWTKYHFGTCDGSIGNYKCIESIKLVGNELYIYFNELGVETFSEDILLIELLEKDLNVVRELFLRIFGDEPSVKLTMS